MKHHLIFTLFILTFTTLYSQSIDNKTTLQRMKLKKSIKKMTITSINVKTGTKGWEQKWEKDKYYEFNKSGNVTVSKTIDSQGNPSYDYLYTYNSFNKLLVDTCIGPSGLYETRKYTYNKVKNLIKKETFKADGKLYKTIELTYDNQNNLIEEKDITASNLFTLKWKYKYNNNNQVIEKGLYSADDTPLNITKSIYDENGNVIETRKFDKDNQETNFNIFKYDTNGNMISDSSNYGISVYTLDKYGSIIADSRSNINVIYNYDDHGNWVQKEKGYFVIQRKIEYY